MLICRSQMQENIYNDLLNEGQTEELNKYFRSQKYSMQYTESIKNLIKRMQKAGYVIMYQPGKRGGTWTARYFLLKKPA